MLLRGARQVGKTYIVRELAQEFTHYVEVNFEKNPDVKGFFDQNLDPERICTSLSAYFRVPILEGETLLFFDEIQSCAKAIQALRFFYESKPALHVIAAGSLLEFALSDLPSWGVGRIRSLYMHPMSFDEFLMANQEEALIDMKKIGSPENPILPVFHERLKEYLRYFMMIGGMPEAVKTFIGNRTDMTSVQNVLSDIATSYHDDFAKYNKRIPVLRLREVLTSVVRQAGGKYMYSKAGSLSNPAQAKEALDLLEMAGLVHKVYHSSGQGIPLGSAANYKMFKCILHDTGIFQQIAGLRISDLLVSDTVDVLNKGSMAEAFVGTELMKYSPENELTQLHYWHREKRGSTAEVDYLIEEGTRVVPVEIKSGRSGKMQSLHLFMKEKQSAKGLRISLENFARYDQIHVLPLYAVSNLTHR
ncbi:MAG: ATP-binding protein [Bacteroidales bacterium]